MYLRTCTIKGLEKYYWTAEIPQFTKNFIKEAIEFHENIINLGMKATMSLEQQMLEIDECKKSVCKICKSLKSFTEPPVFVTSGKVLEPLEQYIGLQPALKVKTKAYESYTKDLKENKRLLNYDYYGLIDFLKRIENNPYEPCAPCYYVSQAMENIMGINYVYKKLRNMNGYDCLKLIDYLRIVSEFSTSTQEYINNYVDENSQSILGNLGTLVNDESFQKVLAFYNRKWDPDAISYIESYSTDLFSFLAGRNSRVKEYFNSELNKEHNQQNVKTRETIGSKINTDTLKLIDEYYKSVEELIQSSDGDSWILDEKVVSDLIQSKGVKNCVEKLLCIKCLDGCRALLSDEVFSNSAYRQQFEKYDGNISRELKDCLTQIIDPNYRNLVDEEKITKLIKNYILYVDPLIKILEKIRALRNAYCDRFYLKSSNSDVEVGVNSFVTDDDFTDRLNVIWIDITNNNKDSEKYKLFIPHEYLYSFEDEAITPIDDSPRNIAQFLNCSKCKEFKLGTSGLNNQRFRVLVREH